MAIVDEAPSASRWLAAPHAPLLLAPAVVVLQDVASLEELWIHGYEEEDTGGFRLQVRVPAP